MKSPNMVMNETTPLHLSAVSSRTDSEGYRSLSEQEDGTGRDRSDSSVSLSNHKGMFNVCNAVFLHLHTTT